MMSLHCCCKMPMHIVVVLFCCMCWSVVPAAAATDTDDFGELTARFVSLEVSSPESSVSAAAGSTKNSAPSCQTTLMETFLTRGHGRGFVPLALSKGELLKTRHQSAALSDLRSVGASAVYDKSKFGIIGMGARDDQLMMVTYATSKADRSGSNGPRDDSDDVVNARVFPDPRLRFGDRAHHHDDDDAQDEETTGGGGGFMRYFHQATSAVRGGWEKKGAGEVEPTEKDTPSSSSSQFFFIESAHAHMWVPADVTSIDVYCHNASSKVTIELPTHHQRHRFHEQAAGEDIVVENKNFVGPPTRTSNVVFVSAGYTQAEKGEFDTTIYSIMNLMNGDPTAASNNPPKSAQIQQMYASVPFNRYWSSWNVFAVFQPSLQSGASRPAIGLKVADNLKCYHPEDMERAIQCDEALTLALARVSPAPVDENPDLVSIIVIVNTNIYGGTGRYVAGESHICHFYNGHTLTRSGALSYSADKYTSLINHEVGHAYGNLFDEYDIGFPEPRSFRLINCQGPQASPVQWQHWIDAFKDTAKATFYRGGLPAEYGVSTSGVLPVCGYTNYYKSSETCMMNRLTNYYMCPVCREGATRVVLSHNFEFQWPRFPLEDTVVVLPQSTPADLNVQNVSTGTVFHLPTFLSAENGYDVKWSFAGNNIPRTSTLSNCKQCLVLDNAFLTNNIFPLNQVQTIDVTITDNSNFVSDTMRQKTPRLVQKSSFRFMIVSDMSGVLPPLGANATFSPGNVTTIGNVVQNNKGHFGSMPVLDSKETIQLCSPVNASLGYTCELTFTRRVYESPEDIGQLLAKYDKWVLYVVGGIAVLFLLLWAWAANYYSKRSEGVVRPIFKTEFTGVVALIRRIMIFSAVLFMIGSLGTMGIATYFYTKMSALGKIVIILGMILAFGLYVMAFIGFWAVTYRSQRLVLVNGFVLFLGFLILVFFCAVVISLGRDIKKEDSFWTKELQKFWEDMVKNNPDRACAIEGMLECSGFLRPCNGAVPSTLFCPANCEETNSRYGTACKVKLQNFISEKYSMLVIILGTCVGLMAFAIIFNFTYYFKLVQMKRAIRERNNERVFKSAQSKNISMKSVENAKALHILKSLDAKDMSNLVAEFRRIDTDGNGQLDKKEMAIFFRKALCYKPTVQEIEELYNVADLDGDGNISLEEFLILFNPGFVNKAPPPATRSSNQAKNANQWRAAMDPNREQELRARMERAYGRQGLFDQQMSPQQPGSPPLPLHQQQQQESGASPGQQQDYLQQQPPRQSYRPMTDRPPDPPNLL